MSLLLFHETRLPPTQIQDSVVDLISSTNPAQLTLVYPFTSM